LSPLPRAESIQVPLLVVHGEHDTNVPVSEALQIVDALRALGREVDYLELEGEGHEFRRTSSRLRLFEAVTSFLTGALSARERV
jgi:dipeptidyl aminopeptidase/acylaminoacyl peptidase